MALPSVTYTFTNGTSADATQVNTNFNDLVEAMTDSSADFTVGSLVVSGAVSLTGNTVTVGNATSDVLALTSRITGDLTPTASATYSIGSSSLGWTGLYMGANGQTLRIIPSASLSSTYTVTLPATTPSTTDAILTVNTSGVITYAHTITTLKSFEGGVYSAEYVGTNPEPGGSTPFQLLTTHKRTQIISPAAGITVKMPTTGIKAGEVWTIVRTSTGGSVTVQSSGGNTIDLIDVGHIRLVALQDTPTTASHWSVIDYYSETTYASTYTFNGTGSPGTSGSVTHYMRRSGKQVTMAIAVSGAAATTGTNSSALTSNSAMPDNYIAFDSISLYIPVMVGGVAETAQSGLFMVQTSGTNVIYRNATSSVFPNATANCGLSNNIANTMLVTYTR